LVFLFLFILPPLRGRSGLEYKSKEVRALSYLVCFSRPVRRAIVICLTNQSLVEFSIIMVASAKILGAGLATIAIGGAATGVGIVFASLITATSRNPSLRSQLFAYAILGFALTEALGLFSLMMAFLLLYAA
jgi:F-type H+-transporting ATPase subunit c